jgi:hypothetical protein
MEFKLWDVCINHPLVLSLSDTTQIHMLRIAGFICQREDDSRPDGFIRESELVQIAGNIPDLEQSLGILIEVGIVQRFEDPAGYQFKRWLDNVRTMRNQFSPDAPIAWGQESLSSVKRRRARSSQNSRNYREKLKAKSKAFQEPQFQD